MPDIPDRLLAALADRYALERPLGTGGMATVYLARDLRHDRQVAIKVLKPDLAAVLGAERFVAEIKTTAALQHPHILPLFDSGEAGGFLWYAMPYIEGETLRGKLDREHQLAVDEAVGITTAVADALDYAHRRGVIHRDIKPENILLHDGRPTVADFGIALAVSAAAGGRLTETGLSLGTPHYMSPEQATADKEITGRSDIYSLASVCYEMLTGDPPHTGSSAQQIIMKIVTEEAAPVTRVRKSVPPNVVAALATALQKLPADRFASAKAFAEALANPGYRAVGGAAETVRPSVSPSVRRLVPALAAALLVATAAALWGWLRTPAEGVGSAWQSTLVFPDSVRIVSTPLLSADGRALYANDLQGPLWRWSEGALAPVPVPGADSAGWMALSPDGRRIAYFHLMGGIRVVPVEGGTPLLVTDSTTIQGGIAWDGPDHLIFTWVGQLVRVPVNGGPMQPFTAADTANGEGWHLDPQPLPNGAGFLFTVLPTDFGGISEGRLAIVGPGGGAHRILGPGAFGRPAGPGQVIARGKDGSILAIPVDLVRGEVTGPAVPLVGGLPSSAFDVMGSFDVAETGRLVYAGPGGPAEFDRPVLRTTPDGRTAPLPGVTAWGYATLDVSPDGKLLAIGGTRTAGLSIATVVAPETGATIEFNLAPLFVASARFTPDGRHLLLAGYGQGGTPGVYRVPLDRSADPELLAPAPPDAYPWAPALSPDGRALWFVGALTGRRSDLLRFTIGEGAPARETVATDVGGFALSRDGQWLAYTQRRNDRWHLRLQSADPARPERWEVAIEGDGRVAMRWRPDGSAILFLRPDSLYAVPLATGGGLVRPRGILATPGHPEEFAVMPDGSILTHSAVDHVTTNQLQMIEDWRALLPR